MVANDSWATSSYTLVSRALGVEAYGTFSSLVAIVLILSSPALIAQMVVAKLTSDLAFDADRVAGLVRVVDRVTLALSLAAGAARRAGGARSPGSCTSPIRC